MTKFFKSVSLALAAALSLSSAALAQSPDLRIAYGDLDLSRARDAAVFQARVDAAVSDWCAANGRVFSGTRSISPRTACREHAEKLVALSIPAAQRSALRVAAASGAYDVAAR